MQHRYLTRFETIWQNKLHVFVACTSNCPLRGLKGLGLVYSGKCTQLIQLVYRHSTQIVAQKQIIQIQHNRIKNPTSRKEQLAEDLNSGRPRKKAASGQSERVRDSNAGPPDCDPLGHADSLFKEVVLESGSLLSNCTVGLFCRGYFFFYWLSRGQGKTVSKFVQNSPIARFVTTLYAASSTDRLRHSA